MPDTISDDLEDDVRELMAARAEAASSDTAAMLAALRLAPEAVAAKFTDATHFVAVVLSRLQRDPSSLEMRLWEIETHANRLWALHQQAAVGSCEASRGSKAYTQVAAGDGDGEDARRAASRRGLVRWAPCCVTLRGESKLKLWQALGEMSALDAQVRYIRIVTELAPEWSNPLSADSALLRTWTPDDESDRCAVCDEVFTFLNRRHHCRRCLNLVCAVCSPHSMPLRVFSQTSKTPQRICRPCFEQISSRPVAADGGHITTIRATGVRIHDPKADALMQRPPEPTYSYSFSIEDDEPAGPVDSDPMMPAPSLLALAEAAIASAASAPAYKHSLSSVSATIHCGHLEFLHGAGFRKNWDTYFFVLLIRKGSLGMFLTETDHVEKKKRPAAVFKLSGYTIRIKSQKRRPHQFRLTHATKKPLHFAAKSIEDMNLWISQLIKAVDSANDLEARPASPRGVEAVAGGEAVADAEEVQV